MPPITDPTGAPEALRAEEAELEKGLSIVTAFASGRVAPRIVEYAGRNAIDLIVLGTHGRRGVRRMLMGSDAESVLREANVPVLLVRNPPGRRAPRAVKAVRTPRRPAGPSAA